MFFLTLAHHGVPMLKTKSTLHKNSTVKNTIYLLPQGFFSDCVNQQHI